MSKISKLMSEDIDVATIKVKVRRALEMLHRDDGDRKRELHVSDFTMSEKQFCYRKLIRRYFEGKKEGSAAVSFVQYDGKFREEKWKRLFETIGILKEYQLELRLGPLVGHPDFLADYGKGPCIFELTGYDSRLDPILRNARLAQKKRQCLTYVIMARHTTLPNLYKGFVFAENKGNNDYDVYPIEYDAVKAKGLIERVVYTNKALKLLQRYADESRDPGPVWAKLPRCENKRCVVCYPR